MQFHYMTYMAMPQQRTPASLVLTFTIQVGRPILSNQTCILNLSVLCLGEEKIFKEIMNFHYKTNMDTTLPKNPFPVGNEIYNFGRRFLRHHNYILSLSVLCLGVEKKIFQEIIYFHYMTYMATPLHKNPSPGGHEIYNFGRPFLVHNYYTLSVYGPCF